MKRKVRITGVDIQGIILIQNNIIEKDLLYRVDDENAVKSLEQGIQIKRDSVVTFDTYYNSFSAAKWKKYTKVTTVGIRFKFFGKAVVEIIHCSAKKERTGLKRWHMNADKIEEEILEIEELPNEGMLYFSIHATDFFVLYEAGWCSKEVDIDDSVNLGLAICTYKREELVVNNLKTICNSLETKELKLFDKQIDIFVSDNGRTLDSKKLENKHIKIFSNKNCGGSGGFARCIIEILEYNKQQKDRYTHAILMDDDAIIEPEVIKRTILFLMCLKEEYRSYFLAGAMLYQEYPCIQCSSGNAWVNGRELINRKENYNLAHFEEVILNEIEEEIDFAGWFYCVVPLKEIEKQELPLPIFIHYDDIEYGLRQRGRFITLNGINVWHPCYVMKNGSYIKYYDVRNALIINSIYANGKVNTRHYIRKYLFREFLKDVPRYNYADLELMLLGVIDFCKGIDWIKKTDAEKRHKELLNKIAELNPIIDVKYDAEFENIEINEKKNRKYDYIKAMLNWVRPLKRGNTVYHNDLRDIDHFIGTDTVVIIDSEIKKGRVYQRNYKKLKKIMGTLWQTLRIISASYCMIVDEYKTRRKEICSVEFWKEYLELF